MSNWEQKQRATLEERIDALKVEYGKSDDIASQRERLEEEHHRRLGGIYTDAGREQECKRYEVALKELEYQEKYAALLEDFQEKTGLSPERGSPKTILGELKEVNKRLGSIGGWVTFGGIVLTILLVLQLVSSCGVLF